MLQRGKTMGNNDRGSAFHQMSQRLLDKSLSLRTNAGGSFVQQHWSIFQESSGQSDSLALTTTEGYSLLTYPSITSLNSLNQSPNSLLENP